MLYLFVIVIFTVVCICRLQNLMIKMSEKIARRLIICYKKIIFGEINIFKTIDFKDRLFRMT